MAHFGSVTFVYVKFRWRGGGGEINTKTFFVSDGTNLYNVCGECVELTQIGTKSSNTRKHVLQPHISHFAKFL